MSGFAEINVGGLYHEIIYIYIYIYIHLKTEYIYIYIIYIYIGFSETVFVVRHLDIPLGVVVTPAEHPQLTPPLTQCAQG